MTLLARIIGGTHKISQQASMSETNPHVISPVKPPNWQATNVRSIPVLPKWRAFTWNEAQAMNAEAQRREQQSKNWQVAMESAERIERLDAKDHRRFRNYQGVVATTELEKVDANAQLAQTLHQLRPKYASAAHRLVSSDVNATRRLTELKDKYAAELY